VQGANSPRTDSPRHHVSRGPNHGRLVLLGGLMSEQQIFAKCAWRLIPLIVAANFVSYIDRTNVGFASVTMNKDVGFSP
jgi:hypothetical protein